VRTSGNTTITKSELVILDVKELEDIIKRGLSSPISEEEGAKLLDSLGSLAWLQQELAKKNVDLARLRSLFGLDTSEKTDKVLGKLSDGESDTGDDRDETEPNKPKTDKPKPKGHGRNSADDYEGAERIEVPHESLRPGDPCPKCPETKQGKVYALSKPHTLVRLTGRSPLHAKVYELQTLRCNLCGTVFVAGAPPGVGDQKYEATAAAMIALLKYGSGLPFNRLARLQGNLRIPLPAATQWDVVRQAAADLVAVHNELIRQAAQAKLVHNDDTSMKVLELRKYIDQLASAGETKRTGIFSTGIVARLEDGHGIALFFTGRNHAGENLTELLRKRAAELEPPMQMCDGLDRNLPSDFKVILANCLVHARRKFVEVAGSFPEEVRYVLETLRDVYKNEADAKKRGLDDEARLRHHQKHSKPLMTELEEWMKQQFDDKHVEPNSSLGSAIRYMQKRWKKLTQFLRVPGAPLDNNSAERALKKAILHRRNSLFYKTENGARVGDIFMALIYTAELAGKNPLDYLTKLLDNTGAVAADPTRWLPWTYETAGKQPLEPDDEAGHVASAP